MVQEMQSLDCNYEASDHLRPRNGPASRDSRCRLLTPLPHAFAPQAMYFNAQRGINDLCAPLHDVEMSSAYLAALYWRVLLRSVAYPACGIAGPQGPCNKCQKCNKCT